MKKTKSAEPDKLLKWFKVYAMVALITALIAFVFLMLPSMLSTDPCFGDWDIKCTYAPGYLQALNSYSLIFGVITFGVFQASLLSVFILGAIIGLQKLNNKRKGK